MIIEPKVRGFICTTAHPDGCYQAVRNQIDIIKQQGQFDGPKNVLVIGASTGYGLASLITAAFGCNANTIGVFFEKAASGKRTASAGWYNSVAFEELAQQEGHYAKSINGDAFSHEIKQQTIDLIRQDLGKIDCVIYSLASPRRTHPDTQHVYNSCLKTIGEPYTNKTLDPMRNEVKEVTIEPANEEEIANTVNVMGGEDWQLWIKRLHEEGLLADGVKTVAYSYIGPELTFPVYKDGTIGHAKNHLQTTADSLTKELSDINGSAFISVNKALVTQASAAIPIVPLYISILYKVMKEHGNHEGCIEQAYRLFHDRLYNPDGCEVDEKGRIRIDDWEMRADIQQEVDKLWQQVNSENVEQLTDVAGYRRDFFQLFGFEFSDVDYTTDIDIERDIPSLRALVD